MKALRLENIHHAYDDHKVVHGVSLDVKPGQLTCLLGPSGCGKTTLLRIAAGLEIVQQGVVSIGDKIVGDGARALHVLPENRGVGLMFQDFALFPHLTVRENVAFGIPKRTKEQDEWLDHALDRMGLTQHAASYPHQLSGGQQQRSALIRALAPKPGVLLLDEPFSGLDVTRRAQIREETLVLLKETGVATLMVTHDPEEAMFMADTIIVMDDGKIVQAGPPVETYFRPANSFVATLFGKVNRFTGTVMDGRVKTPIGTYKCNAIGNGQTVEVLIRPEGIRLLPADEDHPVGAQARVVAARLLGASSYLRLDMIGEDGHTQVIQAKVPDVFLPDEGSLFEVSAHQQQVFIFPVS